MDYLIETKELYHKYGSNEESHSLIDVSIKIREGVKTAILGANGAGKSTLFYHFNGVLRPESGEVLYRGIPLSYKKEHLFQLRDDICVVVQNPDEQIFSSTVEEDVAFGPMNQNLPPDVVEDRIRECLFMVGMEEFRYRPTTQLSYGQRKRVAIAGAIAMKPKVLILDEPTAGLDPQMSQEIMELIDQMCISGTTVIISTHDVDLAYAWADEIHVMRQGMLAYSGEPGGFFLDRQTVALTGLTLPHTFSVNLTLKSIRGLSKSPYPRTNSQLLSKLTPPDSDVGKMRIVIVDEDVSPPEDGIIVGICGYNTRRLFKDRMYRADIYFNAIEGCVRETLRGYDTILYCDRDFREMVLDKVYDLARFGRSPEVIL